MKPERERKIYCAIDKINAALGSLTFNGIVADAIIDCGVTNQKDITYIFDSTDIPKGNRSDIRELIKDSRQNPPKIKLYRTRYKGLGYIHQGKNLWRVVDIHDGLNTQHTVGPHYHSKSELLSDFNRYAKETWDY